MFSLTSTRTTGKHPGRAKKRLAMLSVPLLLGAGLAGFTATPAFANTLGGVSMQNACLNQYGPGWLATVIQQNVFGWACELYPNNVPYSINVSQECLAEYGNSAYATYTNRWDPNSWICVN